MTRVLFNTDTSPDVYTLCVGYRWQNSRDVEMARGWASMISLASRLIWQLTRSKTILTHWSSPIQSCVCIKLFRFEWDLYIRLWLGQQMQVRDRASGYTMHLWSHRVFSQRSPNKSRYYHHVRVLDTTIATTTACSLNVSPKSKGWVRLVYISFLRHDSFTSP